MDEQSIFLSALEKETPEARAAWLAQACGADLRLKARIEALIASHEQASRFLEPPPRRFRRRSSMSPGMWTGRGPWRVG